MATTAMGTTLKFTPASGTQVTVGKLSSIGAVAPSAEVIDVTTLDATGGYRTYMQGNRDGGEVEASGFSVPSDVGQKAIRAAFASGAAGHVVITFADGASAAFDAIVKKWSAGSAEVDGAIGFSAVFKVTGAVTWTEGT